MSHRISGKLLALGVAVLLSAPFISFAPVSASHETQPPFPVCTPENFAPCASTEPEAVSCLPEHTTSGYLQKQIHVEYTGDDTAYVEYEALDCDVTVNLSSYTMPANYDGGQFEGNATAFPQPIFDNVSFDIPAGEAGAVELTVGLPEACNNVQVDAYFGDVIETVGPEGHSTRNLLSQVYLSEGQCEVAPTAGRGGEETPVAAAPVAAVPVAPAATVAPTVEQPQLANTGASIVVAYGAASALAVTTLLGTRYVRKFEI